MGKFGNDGLRFVGLALMSTMLARLDLLTSAGINARPTFLGFYISTLHFSIAAFITTEKINESK
jgi:hypothetical protein